MVTVYLSGPMSGLPDYNRPEFNAAAASLRSLGYEVVNPAEVPEPPCKSWEGYMKVAVAQLVRCDVVALLPGWGASRGARLEYRLAHDLGMVVVLVSDLIPS